MNLLDLARRILPAIAATVGAPVVILEPLEVEPPPRLDLEAGVGP